METTKITQAMNRQNLLEVTGNLTGYWNLRNRFRIKLTDTPLCWDCEQEEEIVEHVLIDLLIVKRPMNDI